MENLNRLDGRESRDLRRFIKKTHDTPEHDIKTTSKRWKEVSRG